MRLLKRKYSIISDVGDRFWICKEVYILGISWSFEKIGESSSQFSFFDIPFYSLVDAKKRLEEILTYKETVLL